MNKSVMIKSLLLLSVLGLVACGGDNKKHSNNNSSSNASSSSVASNVMALNKEYAYTDNTKITNTGKTALVVTKKHYWETNKTVVILQEGSATID
jgi:hypothetical protein